MTFSARLGMLLGSCCAAHVNGSANEKLLSLISRLGYILGNIMAKYDSARVQVRRECTSQAIIKYKK